MTETLITTVLKMAFNLREVNQGLIIHYDRGVQYRVHKYQDLIRAHGGRMSMSRKGNCWDTQSTMLMTSHRSDPCWDWLICLRVDLSTGVGAPECYRAQRL